MLRMVQRTIVPKYNVLMKKKIKEAQLHQHKSYNN